MEKEFIVDGMHCEKCAARLQKALVSTNGVSSAQVDFASKKVLVVFDVEKISIPQLEGIVDNCGFSIANV